MKRYLEGTFNTDQLCLIPYNFHVDEDSIARVIDALVNSFDMENLGFKHATTKITGRKPFDPSDLLKLYLYSYFEGLRSSRKLQKETTRNIEVMWLLNGLQPCFKTIADFRKENLEALMKMFHLFSNLLNELGLYGKELVAVDGSKFRANNSKKKNYTKGKVKRHIEHYEASARKYIELLEENDTLEATEKTLFDREEIEQKIKEIHKKIKNLEILKERIEVEGQISMTDQDARLMSSNNHGSEMAHNVQISVDSKHHLVTAIDVTSSPADQTQLYNMAVKTQEVYDEMKAFENKELVKEPNEDKLLTVLADKGYYSGKELKACEEAGINTIVAPVNKSQKHEYNIKDFQYNPDENVYICPAGSVLNCISKETTENKCYKNKGTCSTCPFKAKCTNDPKGKRIFRSPEAEYYENAEARYAENQVLYKQRQSLVEHVFGTIKRSLGFSYFLLRGNKKVKTESYLHFFIYNLKRAVMIMEKKELIEAIAK